MNSTGIIRRVDDLGGIIIPKTVRQEMKIEEGSPLEFFINRDDNSLILKRYKVLHDNDYDKAKKLLQKIITANDFALYNEWKELEVCSYVNIQNIPFATTCTEKSVCNIYNYGQPICYLAVNGIISPEILRIAVSVLQEFFRIDKE